MSAAEILAIARRGGIVPQILRRLGRRLDQAGNRWVVRHALRRAGVPKAPQIQTYTKPVELEALYSLAYNCPPGANALEIGSHLGASACYIGAGLKAGGGRLFCVDTWNNETMPEGTCDTYSEFLRNTASLGDTVHPIRKRSADLRKTDIDTPLHLVFIDGDHSYPAVKLDFETIRPWLAHDAIVAFHDTVAFGDVARCLGELLGESEFKLSQHLSNLSSIRYVAPQSPRMPTAGPSAQVTS